MLQVPSRVHRLEVFFGKLAIVLHTAGRRLRTFIALHQGMTVAVSVIAASLLIAVRFWHFWIKAIPATLSALARGILAFVQAHPHISHTFHVFMNMVPDIAYLLLALAGVSYLMPKFVDRIEKNRTLRVAVITLFASFGMLAIIVNAVNRADQEDKENALLGKLDKQGQKTDVVGDSVRQVLTYLANTKNTASNEAERRKQVLEALRDQYVIEHPDVPVTMITGGSSPPADWINKRLLELRETWTVSAEPSKSPSMPPQHTHVMFGSLADPNTYYRVISGEVAAADAQYSASGEFQVQEPMLGAKVMVCTNKNPCKEPFEKIIKKLEFKRIAPLNPHGPGGRITYESASGLSQ